MDVQEQPILKFAGVDFPKVHLDTFKAFQEGEESTFNMNVEPRVFYSSEDTQVFHIIMEVKVTSVKYFNLELFAIGNFKLDQSIAAEVKKNLINTNAPAIMFPYVRSFIANLTSSVGHILPTLNIPPHFFSGDLEEYSKENEDLI